MMSTGVSALLADLGIEAGLLIEMLEDMDHLFKDQGMNLCRALIHEAVAKL